MTDISTELQTELMTVAYRLADAARPIALSHFRKAATAVDNKRPLAFDPVTIADLEIEQAFRKILKQARPDDAVLGEEFEKTEGTSGLTWIVDPIDGTRGFISGMPTWGVLIAVADARGPIFGIIDQPYTAERFVGGFGSAVMHHQGTSRSLDTRNCGALGNAILFSTYPEVGTEVERRAFEAVSSKVKLTRYGTDCYAYAMVAAGQVDLVIEAGLNAYDVAAPTAVVEQAGGIVTAWDGGPATGGGRIVAAGNADIHAAALEILQKVVAEEGA
jgi:histidinol phosphatase-like enzyme (inositol monophosphatase family)